jgi:outer membrane usher protein FimD/PapC
MRLEKNFTHTRRRDLKNQSHSSDFSLDICQYIRYNGYLNSVNNRRTAMRDYTITKIRPGTYELDLYVNGSWVDTRRGTKGEVEKFASNYINKRMPQRFIMS